MASQFTDLEGRKVWLNPDAATGIVSCLIEQSEGAGAASTRLFTRVFLKNGDSVDLDADPFSVSMQFAGEATIDQAGTGRAA